MLCGDAGIPCVMNCKVYIKSSTKENGSFSGLACQVYKAVAVAEYASHADVGFFYILLFCLNRMQIMEIFRVFVLSRTYFSIWSATVRNKFQIGLAFTG